MHMREDGVKKYKNFADIISGCSPSRDAASEEGSDKPFSSSEDRSQTMQTHDEDVDDEVGAMKVVVMNPQDVVGEDTDRVEKGWKQEEILDPYLAEDPIVLPEHLQCLVDKAMINMAQE